MIADYYKGEKALFRQIQNIALQEKIYIPNAQDIVLYAKKKSESACLGAVCAFVAVRILFDEAEILSIASLERRRGYGRFLLQKLCDDLKAQGVLRVFLEVRESNQSAQCFYKILGFKKIARRKNYYKKGGISEDALIFMRELTADIEV